MIRYFRYNHIDRTRWDECVQNSQAGLPYAMSWYLDIVADQQWDGLVLNDFEAVCPLPWRTRLGIRYAYQPFFCQQLGISSRTPIDENLVHEFLNVAAKHFKFWI